MLSKAVLLLYENARVYTCALSIAAIREVGFEALPHPLLFRSVSVGLSFAQCIDASLAVNF